MVLSSTGKRFPQGSKRLPRRLPDRIRGLRFNMFARADQVIEEDGTCRRAGYLLGTPLPHALVRRARRTHRHYPSKAAAPDTTYAANLPSATLAHAAALRGHQPGSRQKARRTIPRAIP